MPEQPLFLITGASGGIGSATAKLSVEQGAKVVLAGRDVQALEALQVELGDQASVLGYDINDQTEVKTAFTQIQRMPESLVGLVNCAGVMQDAPLAMTRLADAQLQLQTNALAALQHCQLASRLMARNKRGSIVNLCSAVGEQGSAGQSAYAMSKAALSGLTKSLSQELATVKIRVNGVAPGFIDTALTEAYQGDKKAAVLEKVALKRAGRAEEVAQLIVFLLSKKAAYITGQIIGIDGGMRL